MSGSHLRRQQFTVIELLVVATIISVLASLLLPALTEAKFAARVTACQGNLQQTSRAIIMFANDRERRYLPSGHWGESVLGIAPPSGYQSDEWGARPADVAEYGMTAEVAQCPGVSGEYHRQRRVYWYYNWPVKKGSTTSIEAATAIIRAPPTAIIGNTAAISCAVG